MYIFNKKLFYKTLWLNLSLFSHMVSIGYSALSQQLKDEIKQGDLIQSLLALRQY